MEKEQEDADLPPALPELDTGLACLVMLARFHNIAISPEQLTYEFSTANQVFGLQELLLAARKVRFKAKSARTTVDRLEHTPLPAIAIDRDGTFFILAKQDVKQVLIHDPRSPHPHVIDFEQLEQRWTGQLVLLCSSNALPGEFSRFDFTWFIPAIVKYRRLLGEVLVGSFALQLFALVTPLFFQVVMDKVLVHQGLTTLDVVATGLLGIMLFESALSTLRSYVFAHTASRIDVELGSSLFRHLINLPLAYFQARRVGDSVARVRELENIRSFLTGNAITVMIDVLCSMAFILVMLSYSGWLTLIVVVSLPIYALVSLLVTPLLRKRLQDSFTRNAENQAFLVEAVNGIDTLKSMAVEPQIIRKWDNQMAAYVAASFKTQFLSTLANESVSLIGKLVTVSTLWLGARLVIDGHLSVGELIAFNMLAGHVSGPIMRLAQLWTSFQQTGVSVQRLGDILNSRTELSQATRSTMPPLRGRIEFEQVHFRYRVDGSEVLQGINLDINAGDVIGVVGRSGSGKSTLTRLLQRLYVPERGRVIVDGMDLALADVSSLRRQIGVVLQDNMLFNRSIRENIALSDPGIPLDEVMHVASMAGAHEFILELPEGYDTVVGEHGASLSGGQRQRVAIARALIGDPRILIFDEATSALDYESERIIQQNMQRICQGRTVIIVAHRLSAVRHANRILVMERGQLVEQGTHDELVTHPEGHYAKLYRMQQC
ncbi:type I secretion system permease/ATPase [Candidatus Symbiopectobacterium sp. NZEC127]|uniref:type I secretion system permease/ATPase n=1 Tax=Candidatus Symbiopectobacterium sp. NZEC127 TaxID=2820472 RepID=UPI0022273267|nr:type I secretion system permease/ATPase [Candidatus Symbiopectobacterium sp. NZEC127]MCW2486453.1 type I secretion system permease/ATPase [Candidatus Symbiopectobacterium sp. NZEC127]